MRMLATILLAAERIVRSKRRMLSPSDVRQVLVLEYMLPLGCLVHMTPVFERMRRCRPELEIVVATRGLGLQVLRHARTIDHLIETPDPLTDLRTAVSGLRKELARRGLSPDCILTGIPDRRTRIALLGLLGGGGWRGGYTLKPWLYQKPLTFDPTLSQIGNNLRLAELVGCAVEPVEPRVYFSAADLQAAEGMLGEANPEGKPVVVFVTQNSGGQSTGWHTERFARVMAEAAARGCAVVYVGTAADAERIEAIRSAAGGTGSSIAGRTTVSQLAAVLAMSDFMVTLDTGTMHVGRACGVPMVVLGPSWQRPLEWMPLGVENVRILRGEDRDDVPAGYRLDEIGAESVVDALVELMEAYPASAGSRQHRVSAGRSEIDHLAVG